MLTTFLFHYFTGTVTGEIIITAEEVRDSKFSLHMQLSASKLDKKDLFGKVSSLYSQFDTIVRI